MKQYVYKVEVFDGKGNYRGSYSGEVKSASIHTAAARTVQAVQRPNINIRRAVAADGAILQIRLEHRFTDRKIKGAKSK